MADTTGTRWKQIKSADRLGAGAKGQSCDGTFTAGNLPKYLSDGTTTDSGIAAGSGGGPSGTYNVNFSLLGTPAGGSSILALFVFTESVNFPSNYSGSAGKVGTNPTSSQSWTLNKNGSSCGTVSISTGGVVTFSSSGSVSFSSGDLLTLMGASSADATLANVDIDLQGTRASVTSTPISVVPFQWLGQVPGSQLIGQYVFVNAITFVGNLSGAAYGKVGTNPASTWSATIYKNGTSCGTVSISTSGVFTFTTTSGASVSFAAGDEMTVIAQSTTDTSLQNIAFSFSGSAGGFVQLGGDLGGSSTSPKVIGLQGVGISATAPTNAQALEYNSSTGLWTPTTLASTNFGQGSATASAGNNTITLGSTPITNSLLVVINGVVKTTSAYTLAGAVVTLGTSLSGGDVAFCYWATTGSGTGITLSSVGNPPTIRGTGIQASSATSYTVNWPTGTVSGDFAVIMCGHGWSASTPSGWTSNDNQAGSGWNGAVFSKTLTSGDISAGHVTVSFAGSFDGVIAIITFVGGTAGIRETDFNRNASGGGTVSGPATSSSVVTTDMCLYFGSARSAATCTVNRGTNQQQANDGSSGSGCLYTEVPASNGSITPTFTYSVSPSGNNYQGTVVVRGV